MASSRQKGNDNSIESPHFFKVIIPETLRDGKLDIPRTFVEKYGKRMSSPAVLRVPSGEVWRVELEKCSDGKIWLKNGWQQFSSHYSLMDGYFVVFRYEGNCNFNVTIFDKSAAEIDYPYTNTSNNHGQTKAPLPQQEIQKFEDDDEQPIQILEEIPPSRKRSGTLDFPCPRRHKMMRSTHSSHKTKIKLKSESQASQFRHKGGPERKGDKSTNSHRIQKLKTDKEALQRTIAFQSENPFFLVVMQPSYLGFNSYGSLSVPGYFARQHLMGKDGEVTLYNSKGKAWTVSYHLAKSRKYGALRAGWTTFAQDNNIQVHDVCVFELINCIQVSFKVIINPSQVANNIKEAEALQQASDVRSENPFFSIVMQPSYVDKYLSVPIDFARKYFSKMSNQFIQLLSNGKSWPVKYYEHNVEKLRAQLTSGWRKFVEDNKLEVGDACLFELTKGGEISLKVTINRKQAVEEVNLGSSLADQSRENQVECPVSLVINAESNLVHHKEGMASLSNQHPIEEFSLQNIMENERDAARETSHDIPLPMITLEDKAAFGHKEASQRHPALQHIQANQDTGPVGPKPLTQGNKLVN